MKVKLGEVAEIIMGQSPDSSSYNYEDGLPFFQGNADFGEYYPTIRILCNKPKKIANKYDVLISVRAPVGAVNIANNICAIGRGLAIIRTNANTVNHRYLFYLLKYHRRYIENLGTGSTFKAISKPILNDLCFTIHDIQTQKEIVAVLDKVTSLISMRKEQLEKLDILVKSKFIEMFGDPVLNPKGWEKKKLGEVCNVVVGGDVPLDNFSKEKNEDYNIPIYSNGLAENMLYGYTNNARIQQPCVTVSARGTIGYCFPHFKPFYPIVRLLCVIPSNNFSILFLCHQINSINIKSSGSGVAQLTSPMIKSCALIIPPLDLQNQFAEFVEQVEKNKEKIKSSLNQLETLYSALMQEYFG